MVFGLGHYQFRTFVLLMLPACTAMFVAVSVLMIKSVEHANLSSFVNPLYEAYESTDAWLLRKATPSSLASCLIGILIVAVNMSSTRLHTHCPDPILLTTAASAIATTPYQWLMVILFCCALSSVVIFTQRVRRSTRVRHSIAAHRCLCTFVSDGPLSRAVDSWHDNCPSRPRRKLRAIAVLKFMVFFSLSCAVATAPSVRASSWLQHLLL